ncbi:MAG: tetratricopeptide repeat protein [Desulfobacterales bacterium]
MREGLPRDTLERSRRLYAMGRCDEAVHLLNACLEREPEDGPARLLLAELLLDSERADEALAVLAAAPWAENDRRFLLLRGRCLLQRMHAAQAAEIADGLLTADPENAPAMCLKGEALLAASRADAAGVWFNRALALDPGCAAAWHGAARLRQALRPGEPVLDDLERAVLLRPEARALTLAFHAECLRWNALERGLAVYEGVLGREPFHRRVCFLRIELLLRLGRRAEAMCAVEDAIADFGADEGLLSAALGLRNALGPQRPPEGGRGTVSLCMIVKDEEKTLPRCLRSARGFADEFIVVDTGSADRTPDLAAIFGAQVFRVAWENDFAAARNSCLEKASGDWVLVLDADEVLSSRDLSDFRGLLERHPQRDVAFSVRTRNYSLAADNVGFVLNRGEYAEEKGIGWFPSDKVRLFPNDPRVRFRFPVHELVEPALEEAKIPIRDCRLVVHHYGTLHPERLSAKSQTYRRLEKAKGRGKRGRAAALRESAVQEARLGRFEQAIGLWERFLRRQPDSAEAWLNLSGCHWNTADYDAAAACAARALRIDPRLKEAHFNLAYARLLQGEGRRAFEILDRLVAREPDYAPARFLLGVAAAGLGEEERAAEAFAAVAKSPFGPALGEALQEAFRRLSSAGRMLEAGRLEAWIKRRAPSASAAKG